GASNNDLLMQIQSNFLETNVVRPKLTETTALGVAFLSGLASGFWSSVDELKNMWQIDREFMPKDNNDKLAIDNWNERIKKIQ
ncbi:MAG: glycerol kinase, partial [Flavobacteriaceae bacterium]|nr:glycerol kinase [Flavobacteriaceae bacterium]